MTIGKTTYLPVILNAVNNLFSKPLPTPQKTAESTTLYQKILRRFPPQNDNRKDNLPLCHSERSEESFQANQKEAAYAVSFWFIIRSGKIFTLVLQNTSGKFPG